MKLKKLKLKMMKKEVMDNQTNMKMRFQGLLVMKNKMILRKKINENEKVMFITFMNMMITLLIIIVMANL